MNQIRMNGYARISKAKARKLFARGEEILVEPCKCRPNNCWSTGLRLSLEYEDDICSVPYAELFNIRVNQFEYYNCQYNELGRYAAYYIKEE